MGVIYYISRGSGKTLLRRTKRWRNHIFSSFWASKTWNWMWNKWNAITYQLQIVYIFISKIYLTFKTSLMTPKWQKLASLALEICTLFSSLMQSLLPKDTLLRTYLDKKWWNYGLTLCILMCTSTWNDTINLGWFIAFTTKLFKQCNALRMLNNGNDHDNSA